MDYMYCLRAADTCSDGWSALSLCAELRLQDCGNLIPDGTSINGGFGLKDTTAFLWQVCPKTCGACEGQRQLDEAAIARVRSPCPEGWSYADGSCFRYFADPGRYDVTFWDAQAECEQEGASLAEVDTSAKNHLVFELARQWSQTPYDARASSPWIGLVLRTGAECGTDPQSWYWVASGRNLSHYSNWALNGDPNTGLLYNTPSCRTEFRCAVLNFPSENYYWADVSCFSRFHSAWICSKPALVRPAGFGSCSDLGMEAITSFDACEAALKAIGKPFRHVWVDTAVPRPEGCTFDRWHSTLSVNPATRGQGSMADMGNDGLFHVQVCQQKAEFFNSSEIRLPTGQRPPVLARSETSVQQVRSWSEELTAALCLIGACLLLLVLRRWRLVAARAAASLRSTCCAYLCAWWHRAKLESDGDLSTQVQLGLARRREHVALFAAGALLTHRLMRFVLDHLVADGVPCQSSRAARIGIVGAQVLEICLAAALLASGRGSCRSALILCWELLLPASRLGQAALMGGNTLVDASRPFEELLSRLIHGAVVRPPVALAANVLYTGGSLLLHWSMIPDGMIYLTHSSGCSELYTRGEVDILTRLTSDLHDSLLQRTSDFLSTILRHTTSLARFAQVELLTLTLVLTCLSLLAHLMTLEMRSSLRLQNTEKLLSAVSENLQKLCDAVVHLDSSLRIVRPSPRFAALLHYPTVSAGSGSLIFYERLADDAEAERVRAALRAGQDAEDRDTLSASFRDSFGVAVPCQIFHATFTSLDGQPSHVLGINEVGERDPLPLAPLRSSIQLALGHEQGGLGEALAESRPLAQPREDEGASLASNSLAESSSSDSEGDNSPALERQMDVRLRDFVIIRANAGTTHLFGKDPIGLMLDMLVPEPQEWQAFLRWQVENEQKVAHGELPEDKVQTVGPFHFVLQPFARGDRGTQKVPRDRCYLLTMEVTFPDIDVESFTVETYTVSIRILSAKRVRMESPAPSPAPSTGGSEGRGRRMRKHRRDRRDRRDRRSESQGEARDARAITARGGPSGPAVATGEAEIASSRSDLSLGKESL